MAGRRLGLDHQAKAGTLPKAPSGHTRVRTLTGVSPKHGAVVPLESLMLLRVVYLAVLGARLDSSPGLPVSSAEVPQSCM